LKNKEKAALGAAAAIVIIVIVASINFGEEEQQLFDLEAVEMVKTYQGLDNEGESILDLLFAKFTSDYTDATFIYQSDTTVEWYGYVDDIKEKELSRVGYVFKTYKEDSEYIWLIDKKTGEVIAENESAQKILDQLN